MGLVKRNIHMDCCSGDIKKQITLNQDYNIPDIKPDAQMIVKEQGELRSMELRVSGGRATIKGEVVFQIVYLAENEAILDGLRGSIPFEETVSLGAEAEEEYSLQASMEKFSVRLINSRKTSLMATVDVTLVNEGICDRELAVDVEEEDGLYVQKEMVSISSLAAVKKDTIRARDQWNLPGTKDSVGEFLYWDIRLGEMTSRCMENEIQMTGQATVFAIYLSDGEEPEVNLFESTLPVDGMISCNGVTPAMIPRITTSIINKDVGVMEDDDGENRRLEAEIVVGIDAKVYAREQMELVTDLYSTKKKCSPVCVESSFRDLQTHNVSHCRVQGDLEVQGGKPLQIWDVCGSAKIDKKEKTANGLEIEGTLRVQVLYRREDLRMPMVSTEGEIPFHHVMDASDISEDATIDLQCRVEQMNGNVSGEKSIQVKAVVGLELISFEKIQQPIVVDMVSEDFKNEKNNMPGMVGYVIGPGDTLWDVAKEYYTTTERIREVNKITEEEPSPGDMILIVN